MGKTVEFSLNTRDSTDGLRRKLPIKSGIVGQGEDRRWRGAGYRKPVLTNNHILEGTKKAALQLDDKTKKPQKEVRIIFL
jgi:hypothetical protein